MVHNISPIPYIPIASTKKPMPLWNSTKSKKINLGLPLMMSKPTAAITRPNRIEKIVFVKEEWTPDNNLTTPTLKIKRAKIDERFSDNYESWFKEKEKVLWE